MYSFKKIDDDKTELEYNGEKFEIVKDLDKVVQLQQVDFEARVLLNKKLKEMGVSIEDLEYTKTEGNKKIVNDSQVQELLNVCRSEAIYNKIKKMIQDITGKNILDIAIELGQDKFQEFVQEFVLAVSGESKEKTPSKWDNNMSCISKRSWRNICVLLCKIWKHKIQRFYETTNKRLNDETRFNTTKWTIIHDHTKSHDKDRRTKR